MKLTPFVPALVLGCAWLPSAGCVVTVDSNREIVREERRFTLEGTADVRVTTFDGSIQIQSWDRPDVLIEIEKRGPNRAAVEALQIVSGQQGDVIELEVKRPKSESLSGIGFSPTAYARLTVSVPRASNIRASSGDGSIRIERVSGRIHLRTSDGSIRAADISGDLDLDTADGSVVVDGAEGKLTVETGDGSVNVTGSLGAMKLHTGDGSVIYRARPGALMNENWEITTGDGSVTLYLPEDLNAQVDAHTGDGRITNDLPIEQGEPADRERRRLRGRIGTGGKLLRVRTGDGAIRLKVN